MVLNTAVLFRRDACGKKPTVKLMQMDKKSECMCMNQPKVNRMCAGPIDSIHAEKS